MQRELPSRGGLSSHARQRFAVLGLCSAAVLAVGTASYGGTAVFDFTEDPTLDPNIIINGVNDQPWQATGGNPATGGFLALTYSQNDQNAAVVFPDIDDGKLVSAFRFEADLRIGNSTGDRAADGFSVSFARSNDRYLADPTNVGTGFAGGGPAEFGTETGIAVSFDTWSGNVLPDGRDFPDNGSVDDPGGIIVRVDNVTVLREPLPRYHGACDDTGSLQTGPRDAAYWTDIGDARAPESWATLCWQPLVIEVDTTGKLTVEWKGRKILDQLQTTYFPSAGQLVLAGRTGGANEHTHFDNIRLTTTAQEEDTVAPTAPGNFRSLETGSRRVLLAWDPATDNSGRVAYEIEQDGTLLTTTYVTNQIDLRGLTASTAYSLRVRATDVSGNKSAWVGPLTFTTPALVEDNVFATAQIYGTVAEPISGVAIDGLLFDPRYPASPDRVEAVRGLTYGEPAFGDTYGDNNGVRIAGTVTPPVTGQYHFFIRADDQARLYINSTGPAIPDANVDFPVAAEEVGCCEAFKEPDPDLGQPFETTSEPIQLTAGQRYGVLFIVKEGGGGDWGQVAWRRVGDPTPAGSLSPIGFPAFVPETKPMVDAVGAVAEITQQPQDVTTFANEAVTLTAAVNTASPYNSPVILQWFKNGVAIPGANSTSYTIPVVSQADHAGDYTLQVAVLGQSDTSDAATLTVNTDTKAPTVTSVKWIDPYTVAVNFSEPVQAPTAANFTVSGGVTVSAVQHNGATVQLTTSRHTPDTSYTVTVTGVNDNAGNAVGANTTGTFQVPPFVAGKVKYEEWTNIGGTALAALRGDPRFPANPTSTQFLDSFEAPLDHADNYGAKMTAWYTPPANGSYVFFLSADDNAELFLSTDENPANKKLIAQETGWSASRNWVSSPGSDATAKRSDTFANTEWAGGPGAPINLQAGQRYYVEMQFKEGGGGDNGSILILPAGTEPVNGDAPTGGNVFGSYVSSGGGGEEPTIGIARAGGTITIEFTGTLEGADAITGPWSAVAGATSPYSVTTSGAFRFFRSRD